MNSWISYTFADGVATIRMDNGKVNALGFGMLEALNSALDAAKALDHADWASGMLTQ